MWVDNQAEEAINFYTSVFEDSKILSVAKYGKEGPGPEGTVMTLNFMIGGQEFVALNGGPQFNFSEARSLVINCENQEEVDYYWDKLSEGGDEQGPGWIKDRYGVSWQVVPVILTEMLSDEDPLKSQRVMAAM
ncbi:VOC family protein [Methanobacterium aggregans]|uniref:VOC family protein n=1 Tax=Methanobacterium aggregans TaxID=1615586 RepID=UPI00320F917C